MFPRTTVAAVRPIYEANQRRWLEEQIPDWLKRRQGPGLLVWQWLGLALLALTAYGVGRGLGRLLVRSLINLVGRFFESAMSLVRAPVWRFSASIALASSFAVDSPVWARNRMCAPSGRNTGHRWLFSFRS